MITTVASTLVVPTSTATTTTVPMASAAPVRTINLSFLSSSKPPSTTSTPTTSTTSSTLSKGETKGEVVGPLHFTTEHNYQRLRVLSATELAKCVMEAVRLDTSVQIRTFGTNKEKWLTHVSSHPAMLKLALDRANSDENRFRIGCAGEKLHQAGGKTIKKYCGVVTQISPDFENLCSKCYAAKHGKPTSSVDSE